MRTSSAGHTTNGSHMGSRRRQTRCSRWPSMRAARCPASAPSRFIPAQSSKPGFRVPCRRTRCGQRSRPRARCPPGSSRWAKARRRACGARLRRSSRIAAACTARTATSPSPFLPTIRSRAACGRGHAIRRSRSGCGARARSGPARGSGDDVLPPSPSDGVIAQRGADVSNGLSSASSRLHSTVVCQNSSRGWTKGARRASHGEQCPSYSLYWAPYARRSEPEPTSRSRTWRSGNNSPCSAADRGPQFGRLDRLLWVRLSQRWAGWRGALHIIRPETVIGWHRLGFRAFWPWRSQRNRFGRPSVGLELAHLVRTMALANTLWGAPRIHGELLKLGFEVSQRTVARLMPRRPKPPSQTCRTFLQNHVADLASVDFYLA